MSRMPAEIDVKFPLVMGGHEYMLAFQRMSRLYLEAHAADLGLELTEKDKLAILRKWNRARCYRRGFDRELVSLREFMEREVKGGSVAGNRTP